MPFVGEEEVSLGGECAGFDIEDVTSFVTGDADIAGFDVIGLC
jgi:hypothetical protein